jgi:hypothetical protein
MPGRTGLLPIRVELAGESPRNRAARYPVSANIGKDLAKKINKPRYDFDFYTIPALFPASRARGEQRAIPRGLAGPLRKTVNYVI